MLHVLEQPQSQSETWGQQGGRRAQPFNPTPTGCHRHKRSIKWWWCERVAKEKSLHRLLFLTISHLFNIPSCQITAELLRKSHKQDLVLQQICSPYLFHTHPIKIHRWHPVDINMFLSEEGVHRASLAKVFLSLVSVFRAAQHVSCTGWSPQRICWAPGEFFPFLSEGCYF